MRKMCQITTKVITIVARVRLWWWISRIIYSSNFYDFLSIISQAFKQGILSWTGGGYSLLLNWYLRPKRIYFLALMLLNWVRILTVWIWCTVRLFCFRVRVWSWVRYSSFKEDQLRCECIGYRKSHGRFKIGSIKILQCIPCISIQILQDYPTGNSRTTESFSPFLCPMEWPTFMASWHGLHAQNTGHHCS